MCGVSWTELLERAVAHETTVDAVRKSLRSRREGGDDA